MTTPLPPLPDDVRRAVARFRETESTPLWVLDEEIRQRSWRAITYDDITRMYELIELQDGA